MSQTLPLDMLISLELGMFFSLARGKDTEEEALLSSRHFRTGLGYHFIVAFGVAFVCYKLYPDWMLMYLVDRRRFSRGLAALAFFNYFAMYTVGFLLAPRLRKAGWWVPVAVFSAVFSAIFSFIGFTFNRLWHVGTFDEYHAGTARPIIRTPLFPILGAALPAAVLGLRKALQLLEEQPGGLPR